jgi:hypothetical protein
VKAERLSREQRAERHYAGRASWLRITLRRSGAQAFGIPSLHDPSKYHVCNGDGCTCADFRFRGLSAMRFGRGAEITPCSHMLAVQRALNDVQAAVAEPPMLSEG